jgi:phosphoglycerol transferase
MSISMNSQNTGKTLRRTALVTLVWMLALLTWLPHLARPVNEALTGDSLFEQTGQQMLCGAGPITGWPVNDGSIGATLGTFAPTLPGFLVARAACTMENVLPISGEQAFLIIGISFTVMITYIAARAVNLGIRPALLISYGLATAPCSFSRVNHLQLSQLWAIMPCIAVCALLLARERYPSRVGRHFYSTGWLGLAMGILSFTAQEYYAAFSSGFIIVCYAAGAAFAAKQTNSLSQHEAAQNRTIITGFYYIKIAAGYVGSMILYISSKQLLWRIPEWAHRATARHPIEQFIYGFWPSNILTSPLVNSQLREIFTTRNQLPVTETPFNSSSGILVITALGIITLCWMRIRRSERQILSKHEALIMAFGGVLILIIILACLIATPGGLGTLFAVLVSPQLRALNRITPYFYCSALAVCAIRLDEIIAAIAESKRGSMQP